MNIIFFTENWINLNILKKIIQIKFYGSNNILIYIGKSIFFFNIIE